MKKVENRNEKLIAHWNPKSSIAESYRTLRTNIQFASIGKIVKSILVTSTQPGEGKTTTSANLAIVMGQAGKKTVYVDADLRRPSGSETFHVNNFKGVTSYLVGNEKLEDIMQETGIPNVSVITAGPIPPNPAELLGSQEMSQFIAELQNRFDMVIIDSPPALAVADAVVLSTLVDGCLIVINAGKTNEDLVGKVTNQLQMANAKIFGVVLNKLPQRKRKEADYYYYQADSTKEMKSPEKRAKIEKVEKLEKEPKQVMQKQTSKRSEYRRTKSKR